MDIRYKTHLDRSEIAVRRTTRVVNAEMLDRNDSNAINDHKILQLLSWWKLLLMMIPSFVLWRQALNWFNASLVDARICCNFGTSLSSSMSKPELDSSPPLVEAIVGSSWLATLFFQDIFSNRLSAQTLFISRYKKRKKNTCDKLLDVLKVWPSIHQVSSKLNPFKAWELCAKSVKSVRLF